MSDWGPWRVYGRKIKGNLYLRRQRGRRIRGTDEIEKQYEHLGPAWRVGGQILEALDQGRDMAAGRNLFGDIMIALVGNEDKYGRKYDSLYNRYKERAEQEKAAASAASNKSAVGGNKEPTTTGSNTASEPSRGSEDQAAPEQPSPTES
jgi:hypothetical protein